MHSQLRKRTSRLLILGYGVMVTLQILVLSFLVRVRVSQPTLIAECIAAFLGNILQVVLEVVEVALCVGGMKFLVGCIDSLMILFIDLVFLFERNVSDCTVLLGKIFELLLEIVV